MQVEGKHVDQQWYHNKPEDTEANMSSEFRLWASLVHFKKLALAETQHAYLWHFVVAKLIPQVLRGV